MSPASGLWPIIFSTPTPLPLLATTDLRLELGLAIFGIAAISGISCTGAVIDRAPRLATLSSLAVMSLAVSIFALSSTSAILATAAIALWGLGFGGAPVLVQTALADAAGQHIDTAQSLFVTVFNLAIACGGLIGGLLLSHAGVNGLVLSSAAMCLFALCIVLLARGSFSRSRSITHAVT